MTRIATAWLPQSRVALAEQAAQKSHAYDPARTRLKLQRRTHEHLDRLEALETARVYGVPAPALLDKGTVDGVFYSVIARIDGAVASVATPAQQSALGRALRTWHDRVPAAGLALDDPGALGVFFGTLRGESEGAANLLGRKLLAACEGKKRAAIHSDVAVTHNALFAGDSLRAIIDPGAIAVAPAMLDLAWALAVDDVDRQPLIAGYGADGVDLALLEALMPLMYARRFGDMRAMDRPEDAARLFRRAPDLIKELGL